MYGHAPYPIGAYIFPYFILVNPAVSISDSHLESKASQRRVCCSTLFSTSRTDPPKSLAQHQGTSRIKMAITNFGRTLFRTKKIDANFMETRMKRCLTTFDITLLGVGHMVGAGIYVLTGAVVRNIAGAGIIVSFILAGMASALSALCYAEFGARVPKAGSAYTYTYVTVGELWAFIIGWNIILEHMIGAAAVARSWSGYLDSLVGHAIRNETIDYMGEFKSNIFGGYPDFVAFLVVVVVSIFMGIGAKSSTHFNTAFTCVNIFVIGFVIALGFSQADVHNWSDQSNGGFAPYGTAGIVAGAASCFFAFIGFDSIATSGEEAANPSRSIPLATFISLSIVTLAYVLVSMALTLMVPYNQVHPSAAFADAFEQRGMTWAKYVVAVGALSGMTTSLVGGLFALPRCVYAMANDGLIFRSLSHIHAKTQVPTLAVLVFGAATAVIALLFDIETLVEFLSIGTLLAYSIVSSSVIILRYKPTGHLYGVSGSSSQGFVPAKSKTTSNGTEANETGSADNLALVEEDDCGGKVKPGYSMAKRYLGHFQPGWIVNVCVVVMNVATGALGLVSTHGGLTSGRWYGVIGTIILSLIIVACVTLIHCHQQSRSPLRFKVPFVPFLPAISNLVNIVMMFHLAPLTWLRLAIWLAVGFLLYFGYGIRNSSENSPTERRSLVASPGSGSVQMSTTLVENTNMTIERAQPRSRE